jgi:hypothetical protein
VIRQSMEAAILTHLLPRTQVGRQSSGLTCLGPVTRNQYSLVIYGSYSQGGVSMQRCRRSCFYPRLLIFTPCVEGSNLDTRMKGMQLHPQAAASHGDAEALWLRTLFGSCVMNLPATSMPFSFSPTRGVERLLVQEAVTTQGNTLRRSGTA